MAVVVIAFGDAAEAVDAVRSLLIQEPFPEIVVVNTGGTGMAGRLRAAGIEVEVIERAEPLFVGAARNIGIAATRAPFVAFLAADCRAEPGWVAARLALHRGGFATVGSALTNSHKRSAVAWAAHLTSFSARLPGLSAGEAIAYGASYERGLFAVHGLFRQDLRTGEDTEFNQRLPPAARPVWSSDVRTVHLNPTNLFGAIGIYYQRGRRWARAQSELKLTSKRHGIDLWYSRVRFSLRNTRRALRGTPDWPVVWRARLYVPLLHGAFTLGAHREGFPKAPPPPPARP